MYNKLITTSRHTNTLSKVSCKMSVQDGTPVYKCNELFQCSIDEYSIRHGIPSKFGWGRNTCWSEWASAVAGSDGELERRLKQAKDAIVRMEKTPPETEYSVEWRAEHKARLIELETHWNLINGLGPVPKTSDEIECEADKLDQQVEKTPAFWMRVVTAIAAVQEDNKKLDEYEQAAKAAWSAPGAADYTDVIALSNANMTNKVYVLAMRSIGNKAVMAEAVNSLAKATK